MPSHGLSTHLPLYDLSRHVTTLSGHERRVALLLGHDCEIHDIKEQFPCLPVSRTEVLAAQRGIVHPRVKGIPIERTLDFLVDHATLERVALSVKPSQKLDPRRAYPDPRKAERLAAREWEKLEIERAFANGEGWPWALVTEVDIPLVRATNLDALAKRWTIKPKGVAPARFAGIAEAVMLAVEGGAALLEACHEVDAALALSMEGSVALAVALHWLARKRWSVDLDQPFDVRVIRPLREPPRNHSWVAGLKFLRGDDVG